MTREIWDADVLVVGGGITAVFAACKARAAGADVLMVDQGHVGRSGCTPVASGVIEMFMPGDDAEAWSRTEKSPLTNHALYRANLERYPEILDLLEEAGVKFIKDGSEYVRLPSGRSEDPSNTLLAGGGPQLGLALRALALKRGVRTLNRVQIRGLLTSDGRSPTKGRVIGAVGFGTRTADTHIFTAPSVVMCTGPFSIPYGRLNIGWATRYMPIAASGDGHRAMWEAGATMGKLELGYQGPRAIGFTTAPAIEMLAGIGGHTVYVNRKSERFLSADFRKKEWGRSSIFTAMMREVSEGRGPVGIDVTHFSAEERRLLKQVVPIVIENFESAGIDISSEAVPYMVAPPIGVGSSGGGARIDPTGRTDVEGLFAAGNCSDGAYVTLGQGLGICAMTGLWAGESAAEAASPTADAVTVDDDQVARFEADYLQPILSPGPLPTAEVVDILTDLRLDLTPTMNSENLSRAMAAAGQLDERLETGPSATDAHGLSKINALRSSVKILRLALRVMLHREESRGNLIRDDFPMTDNDRWLVHTVVENDGTSEGALRDIPIPPSFWITAPPSGAVIHNYFTERTVSER